MLRKIAVCCLLLPLAAVASAAEAARVGSLKVTVLSTMLAEADALGEWGFAALVEADGHRLLFDTGARPDTVLDNARSMGLDLAGVEDVVLSHNHGDHTGGLARLRSALAAGNPRAMARAHVAPQIFWPRFRGGRELPQMAAARGGYEAAGGRFVVHDGPAELWPGVWFSGPIPRKTDEKNFPSDVVVLGPDGARATDEVPEDAALVFDTPEGLVVLSGCGHAGIVNTASYARQVTRPTRIAALLGGFHLFSASDERLDWTAARLREIGVDAFLGAHCTGIEAVYRLRQGLGLARSRAIVAAVGSSYTLGKGLDAGGLGLAK